MSEEGKSRDVLRHPLTLVLTSFLLTSVLGVGFSHWIANQASEAEQSRREAESRKTAVQNLSRLIYERRARADMLASSFLRNAQLDEIKDRKKAYDEALVAWNINSHVNLFLVREVLGTAEYSFIEHAVEFTLVDNIFRPLDICLTRAYDASVAGQAAGPIVQECGIRAQLQSALDCGYAIADELYKLAGAATSVALASAEIKKRCPQ